MSDQVSPSSGSKSSDEIAVAALYRQLMEGWNEGSGEAYAAQFADDGDLIGFDGTHFKGRRERAQDRQSFLTYGDGNYLPEM